MKYTIKELMDKSIDELEQLCWGCVSGKCPFPKRLMKLREDGYCIKECYVYAKKWIAYDKMLIEETKRDSKYRIKKLKERIRRNEKLIKEIENGRTTKVLPPKFS